MQRNGWTVWHFIGAAVMMLFAVWMTFPAWREIYAAALDPEGKSRHILLVPAIAVWLIWVRRRRILYCNTHGHWYGLVLILVGGIAFTLSSHAESQRLYGDPEVSPFIDMAWHAGAVLITIGCALTPLGVGVIRRYLPAIIVLMFLVPIPRLVCDEIELPVKAATIELTATIYDSIGMDVHVQPPDVARQPPMLLIKGESLVRHDAYHGLPMVFDLFLVSWAFVFGSPLRPSVRVIILMLSPVSAIVCGAAGLIATYWVYGNPLLLAQADIVHEVGAWLMLIVAFLLLTAVIRALAWASVPVRAYTLAYDL